MIRTYLSLYTKNGFLPTRFLSSLENVNTLKSIENPKQIDTNNFETNRSVLEPLQEDISHIAPYLKPAFNFAAYVNKSETLQQLVHLGVELYKLEKDPKVPALLLRLDFERDIKKYITFLLDLGLETDDLGPFITKNPFILSEDLASLDVRINYLKSKKFTSEMIQRIVKINPRWLNNPTQDIDKCLGFFQKSFLLNGDQVRQLAVKAPKLITYNQKMINVNIFTLKEELGYQITDLKEMVLDTPKILIKDKDFMIRTFEYLHNTMEIPTETIQKIPKLLMCRVNRLRARHLFLERLNKVQFDAKQPNYISPLLIVQGTDGDFAADVAGSSIQAYNAFLKTL